MKPKCRKHFASTCLSNPTGSQTTVWPRHTSWLRHHGAGVAAGCPMLSSPAAMPQSSRS